MPSCIVKGCTYSWKKKDPDIIIHAFPKDLESIQRWLLQTKQDFGDIEEFSRKILAGTKGAYRLCSRHFTADSYETRGFLTVLKKGAIPTIFPDIPIEGYKNAKFPAKRRKVDPRFTNYGSVSGIEYHPSSAPWHPISIDALSSHDLMPPLASSDMYVPDLYMYRAGGQVEIHPNYSHSWISTGGLSVPEERRKLCHPKGTRTIGTMTGHAPGRTHQSTNTELLWETSNKQVQANRRKKHNTVGIQCNSDDLPFEVKRNHYPLRISLRDFDVLLWVDPFSKKGRCS
ncbi:hypothetical protein GDO81_025733 [Engystomops pustulosus]|uniref:THAP-type domain-containing protein n=1 Tax=Engystomops pustulosus TaxID=76066 RepID=A0AAV6ZGQ7_ENGPU|nr:hypothetical protein GDO81_025733 [Engystomops pustulosus]